VGNNKHLFDFPLKLVLKVQTRNADVTAALLQAFEILSKTKRKRSSSIVNFIRELALQ